MNANKKLLIFATLSTAILAPLGHADEFPWADVASAGFRKSAKIEWIAKSSDPAALTYDKSVLPSQLVEAVSGSFQEADSRAILISKDGKVIYENYSDAAKAKSWTPIGMSMSKSVTAMAVGKAHCDGHIKSLDEPLKAYVPRLSGTSWGEAPIKHVLMMSSGAYQTDSRAHAGHKDAKMQREIGVMLNRGQMTTDFIDYMKAADEKQFQSGQKFNYNNFDTIALGLLVSQATKRPFPKFVEESIWRAARMEYDAAWMTNNLGQASAYQGLSAHPHDWIRLGQWVLKQLDDKGTCFSEYLAAMTSQQIPTGQRIPGYGYQTWIECAENVDFCFIGFGGQYLAFNRAKRAVIYHHAATNNFMVHRIPGKFGRLASQLPN